MYGLDGLNDEQIQQLLEELATNSPQQSFQAQSPQLTQGLLGDSGQEQQLQDLIARGQNAAQMQAQPQIQSDDDLAQRQAMAQQQAMQGANQQSQRQAQMGNLLGTIASLFIPSLKSLKFVKG